MGAFYRLSLKHYESPLTFPVTLMNLRSFAASSSHQSVHFAIRTLNLVSFPDLGEDPRPLSSLGGDGFDCVEHNSLELAFWRFLAITKHLTPVYVAIQ